MFRSRDRVCIRILGSVLLTNGSGSGSCSFRQWPSRRQPNFFFSRKFLCLFLFEDSSKIKILKKSQNSRFKVFLHLCLLMEGAGFGSVQINYRSGSRRPKNIRIQNTVLFQIHFKNYRWSPL